MENDAVGKLVTSRREQEVKFLMLLCERYPEWISWEELTHHVRKSWLLDNMRIFTTRRFWLRQREFRAPGEKSTKSHYVLTSEGYAEARKFLESVGVRVDAPRTTHV